MEHFFTDGGTRVENGETFAGWGAIARSLHGRIGVMFGPVITTEVHLAFSGARTHSNNTTERTAMIEALSFLGPQWPEMSSRVSSMILNTAGVSLGTIQARTHVQLALACQQSIFTGYGSPCSTCIVTVEIWVMNVLTMLRHLVHLASSLTTTLPTAGFVITLTHLCVLVAVTTSARFWKD